MAYVLADQQSWLTNTEQQDDVFRFNALHDFKSMRDSVNNGTSDFFMWETFTTKPYHDSGEVKRIGQITPPWPAFLFAAHTDCLQNHADELERVLKAIQKATKQFMDQKDGESVHLVMKTLGYQEEDVRNWFKIVHYAEDHTHVSRRALQVTVSTLIKAGVLKAPAIAPEDLVDEKIAKLD